MTEAPLLDVEAQLGPSLMPVAASMLTRFEERARQDVAMLCLAIENGFAEEAIRAAHSLCGSAYVIGAKQLGHCAANVEKKLQSGETVNAEEVSSIFRQTTKAIEDWLASQS